MKVAILLCVMCVVVGTFAQMPSSRGAAATTGAAGGAGGSDAMRAMMMSRMLAGRGGGRGGLANLLLLRGGLEPMEFLMCRQNVMMCMMMMN